MVDPVESQAQFYNSKVKEWEESVENMSKNDLKRALKALILFPLELEDPGFTTPQEIANFEFTTQLLDAKMTVMAYAVERNKIRQKLSEGI